MKCDKDLKLDEGEELAVTKEQIAIRLKQIMILKEHHVINEEKIAIYKDLGIIMEYDEEERDIILAFERGELELRTPTKEERESIRNAAINTLKELSNPADPAIRRGR